MVLLPLAKEHPQTVEHVLLGLHPILELALFNLGVFPYTVDHCDLFVYFLSDQPVVL
jgi:hypothetical protein